jgi:hypothetical protein
MSNESIVKNSLTDWQRLAAMTDEDIDFSDCPEATPEMFENVLVKRKGVVVRKSLAVPNQEFSVNQDQYLRKLWNWAFHEDDLFDARMQGFLTTNTLIIAVAGFVLSKENPSQEFLFFVTGFGFFVSIILLFVQYRIAKTVDKLSNLLHEKEPVFREVFPKRAYFVWVKLALPSIIVLGWVGFGIWVYASI